MTVLLSEYLRPQCIDDIALCGNLRRRLAYMLESRDVMNMLFHGRPGSGKTTTALLFTTTERFDVLKLNGSLATSVEDVRSKVLQFATCSSLHGNPKICFIDEADYLSKNAQGALRGVIEQTQSICRYIFTANAIEKMQAALRSRLLPVSFDLMPSQIPEVFSAYTTRTLEKLSGLLPKADRQRATRIMQLYFPDYRAIANNLEYELLCSDTT